MRGRKRRPERNGGDGGAEVGRAEDVDAKRVVAGLRWAPKRCSSTVQ